MRVSMKSIKKFNLHLQPTVVAKTPESQREELFNVLYAHLDHLEEHLINLREELYELYTKNM